jgi:3-hydroxy-9,10-secoandrosta-1,3,5(10)-triene-9,17-dione monooxygenase reductase component
MMDERAAVEAAAFRRVMGQFATGVTVITAQVGDEVHGMTANSFTAVSLDPPLVLFCVAKTARMAAFVQDAPGVAINILSAAQESVSRQFAGSRKPAPSEVAELLPGPVAPLIAGALASISCAIEAIHEGGDHWVVIGRVLELHEPSATTAAPLVFFRAHYGELVERAQPRPEVDPWANDAMRLYHDEWSAVADALAREREQ